VQTADKTYAFETMSSCHEANYYKIALCMAVGRFWIMYFQCT